MPHATIHIRLLSADVDREIAPLIRKMNRVGISTTHCCQGDNSGKNFPYVAFKASHPVSLLAILEPFFFFKEMENKGKFAQHPWLSYNLTTCGGLPVVCYSMVFQYKAQMLRFSAAFKPGQPIISMIINHPSKDNVAGSAGNSSCLDRGSVSSALGDMPLISCFHSIPFRTKNKFKVFARRTLRNFYL